MDTSAVDLFREIVALCNDHHCKLFLSGVNPNLRSVLIYAGIKRTNRTTIYLADLETALGKAEDELLSDVLHVEEKEIEESQRRGRSRSMSDALKAEDGFVYALSKIEEQHGVPAAKDLADFGPHTTPISLLAGEVLVRDSRNPGIYFVESGLLRVKHATGRSTMSLSTATATSASTGLVVDPGLSIGHLNARTTTLGRKRAAWKKDVVQRKPNEQTFRLARVGQGWVIGSIQAATANEIRSHAGVHVAETDCLLHFLPYKCVLEMETEKPALAMALYKLMSLLATKRQESTIQQLDQLVKILNTPTPRLGGGGKRELAKLQQM